MNRSLGFNVFMDGEIKEIKCRIKDEEADLVEEDIVFKVQMLLHTVYTADAVLFAESVLSVLYCENLLERTVLQSINKINLATSMSLSEQLFRLNCRSLLYDEYGSY